MKRQFFFRTFLAVAASIFFVNAANAISVTNLSHADQSEVFPDGNNYLNVVVRETGNGNILFTVKPLEPLSNIVFAGIDSFAFNFGTSGASIDNVRILGDANWSTSENQSFSSFGEFDALLQGSTSKNILRFLIVDVDGDTVDDYLTELSRGLAPSGNFLFGAGFATDIKPPLLDRIVVDRGDFAGGRAVVPIPAAVWLMASGLSFLAFFHRMNGKTRT